MSSEDKVRGIVNQVVEGLRKRYVQIQKYSFFLDGMGGVRRVPERGGNWIEMSAGHELFDAEVVRSVIEEDKIDLEISVAATGAPVTDPVRITSLDALMNFRAALGDDNEFTWSIANNLVLCLSNQQVGTTRISYQDLWRGVADFAMLAFKIDITTFDQWKALSFNAPTQPALDASSEHHAEGTRGRSSC